MSGRKYSRYTIENTIREALRCGLEARDLVAQADGQIRALTDLAEHVPAVRAILSSVESAMQEIRSRLATIEAELKKKRWIRLSIEEVRAFQREVIALRDRLKVVTAQCVTGETIASRRVEFGALLSHINSQESDLRAWCPNAYDALRQEVTSFVTQLDAALRSGTPNGGGTSVEALRTRLAAIHKEVGDKRLHDTERRDVLEALKKVCEKLGFAVVLAPQASPTDDLLADVNTFSHGTIRFRLQLDGAIRSESPMIKDSCTDRFEQIEDGLHQLGVSTEFRYEADGKPVRCQRGSKSLPNLGADKQVQQGGSR